MKVLPVTIVIESLVIEIWRLLEVPLCVERNSVIKLVSLLIDKRLLLHCHYWLSSNWASRIEHNRRSLYIVPIRIHFESK